MSVFVAVDTGGTFTDLVAFDQANGQVRYTKSLTTHGDPIEGIENCLVKTGIALDRAELFKHGTTLVINTLLERSGPRIGLVATQGFRDVLELGRGSRTETFNLFFHPDPPLVARDLRFEVSERIDAAGAVVTAPDRTEVEAVASRLRQAGVSGIVVSFINSYLEPRHEQQVARWLRDLLPDCYVTCGADLTREWYEYERTATAAANAYTGHKIGGYISRLERELGRQGFRGRLLLMGSNGGVLSAAHAAEAPVLLVESGPVGGCIGAGAFGEALGIGKLIAFDMGGTTAKCAIVNDGEFDVESTYYAGGYGRGIPIRAPVVDIVEVGAGGGSIAWVDAQGGLNVGPRSAGSKPGPVCYGRGGEEPTVTDANLVLGRLNPEQFQGGEMRLDADAALRAIVERIADPLGYSKQAEPIGLAAGILSIAAVKMSEAIKRITVERGLDPRDFALFAYGGGGPLHAVELARELGILRVIIPPEAGNFSAIGMLLADIRLDESRTFLRPLAPETMAEFDRSFAAMEKDIEASLRKDFGDVAATLERSAELRFVGQYHTVRVPVRGLDCDALQSTFHDIYRGRYGHAMERSPAEIVSLHSTAKAATHKPDIRFIAVTAGDAGAIEERTRDVYFPARASMLPAKIFGRRLLPRGFSAAGPAVIEEYGSTTILGPDDSFAIGELGEIRVEVGQAPAAGTG